MPFIGNGIKSKEVGKSGVKTGFTSQFMSFHKMVYKIGPGKREFVNRSTLKRSLWTSGAAPSRRNRCRNAHPQNNVFNDWFQSALFSVPCLIYGMF